MSSDPAFAIVVNCQRTKVQAGSEAVRSFQRVITALVPVIVLAQYSGIYYTNNLICQNPSNQHHEAAFLLPLNQSLAAPISKEDPDNTPQTSNTTPTISSFIEQTLPRTHDPLPETQSSRPDVPAPPFPVPIPVLPTYYSLHEQAI